MSSPVPPLLAVRRAGRLSEDAVKVALAMWAGASLSGHYSAGDAALEGVLDRHRRKAAVEELLRHGVLRYEGPRTLAFVTVAGMADL